MAMDNCRRSICGVAAQLLAKLARFRGRPQLGLPGYADYVCQRYRCFFIGSAWGKHKLAPTISEGKTQEGAIGGLICAVLGAIVIATVLKLISLQLCPTFNFKYWQVIVLGFLVSIFAQLGDLVESLLKRNMGVKESGNLLPGHGGILDRFDSLIFVGAVVYYYVIWVV